MESLIAVSSRAVYAYSLVCTLKFSLDLEDFFSFLENVCFTHWQEFWAARSNY
jgi:hypothetical protein